MNSGSHLQTAPRPASPVVYLARHATPDWNMRDIRYDIPPGPPLVPQGEAEAAQLGAFLRAAGIVHIYASPLERTRRTAQIAGEVAAVAVTIVDAIAEHRREESREQVLTRFAPFFDQAWAAAANGPVAVVSHGGPVHVMLEHLGVTEEHLWHYRRQFDHQNPIPPAGAWAVTRSAPAGSWQARLAFAPGAHTPYLLAEPAAQAAPEVEVQYV